MLNTKKDRESNNNNTAVTNLNETTSWWQKASNAAATLTNSLKNALPGANNQSGSNHGLTNTGSSYGTITPTTNSNKK